MFRELMMLSGGGNFFDTTSELEIFIDSPSPRRKKFKTFHRNANVRAGELDMAISACESRQRGLGFNVVFSRWVGSRKYKIVTKNYFTYVEEIFWFHVY